MAIVNETNQCTPKLDIHEIVGCVGFSWMDENFEEPSQVKYLFLKISIKKEITLKTISMIWFISSNEYTWQFFCEMFMHLRFKTYSRGCAVVFRNDWKFKHYIKLIIIRTYKYVIPKLTLIDIYTKLTKHKIVSFDWHKCHMSFSHSSSSNIRWI